VPAAKAAKEAQVQFDRVMVEDPAVTSMDPPATTPAASSASSSWGGHALPMHQAAQAMEQATLFLGLVCWLVCWLVWFG